MGKLITWLVLLGGGFGIYWTQFHKSPAYLAYLQWTNAYLAGDCKTLGAMADGDAKKWLEGFCGASGGMTLLGQTIPATSPAAAVAAIHDTPMGSSIRLLHEVEKEDEADDGTVSLSVIESVGNPPTAHFKPAPPRRQSLKLKEINGVWKVLDFQEKDI